MENGLKAEALPQWDDARIEAIDFTRATGREYGILMDPIAGIVDRVEGGPDSVSLEHISDKMAGRWVIHTHPSTLPLSPQDVMAASIDGVKGVVALGEDGGMYEASNVRIEWQDYAMLNFITEGLTRRYAIQAMAGALTREEADFMILHKVHIMASKAGIYDYKYRIGARWQGVVDRYERLTRKPLDGLASGV